MNNPLTQRYPGRFIIIGNDSGKSVVVYGATGRSPSSLARRFVQKGNEIFMQASDDTVLKEGNVELLEYPAVRIFENGIVVANGRQINNINSLHGEVLETQLTSLLQEETYEPDAYKTPRITGAIVENGEAVHGALHIARSNHEDVERFVWNVSRESNTGSFISTYGGADVIPTPSFEGNPVLVTLQYGSAKACAEALYENFAPKEGESDYRVGILAIYREFGQAPEIAMMNRIDIEDIK
ncbi:hypothetical protein EPO56_01815 [Patescibacteria group bacterium]|nr:MAG: hypothetical protein EPO56_01815 [Patescibacteria group bacterium]